MSSLNLRRHAARRLRLPLIDMPPAWQAVAVALGGLAFGAWVVW